MYEHHTTKVNANTITTVIIYMWWCVMRTVWKTAVVCHSHIITDAISYELQLLLYDQYLHEIRLSTIVTIVSYSYYQLLFKSIRIPTYGHSTEALEQR